MKSIINNITLSHQCVQLYYAANLNLLFIVYILLLKLLDIQAL